MTIVIIDDSRAFRDSLGRQFVKLGHETWPVDSPDTATNLFRKRHADLVISEIRPFGRDWRTFIDTSEERALKVAIVTNYGSVANALSEIRAGVCAYLTKPVTAVSVLQSIGVNVLATQAEFRHFTLDRAIWEYIHYVVETAGSLSEAARRLGIDRTSLKRMLTKYAPPV